MKVVSVVAIAALMLVICGAAVSSTPLLAPTMGMWFDSSQTKLSLGNFSTLTGPRSQ